ncbi:PH domain-containing protein [Sphingobacterium thalpophilum]|uniref:PH domain-containing protein n=1 Tax=Sphingobacterium thalpophilum TaxID=259 RepID=A0A4U9V9E5_9SPHI|nr:PH domain-containing protein [Sphingobacterium thalpophilum]VTR43356.1 Uncharacterised protein [Sphingobacterium thalpophilum]
MKYKASLDNLAKIMTVGVTVVFTVIITKQFEAIKEEQAITPFLIAGGFILLYVWTLLFRPLNYRVTDTHLIIHRPLKDIVMERNAITNIERLDDAIVQKSVRTFGVGGLFEYFGKYANRTNGSMTWYATRRSSAVLICTNDNKKVVLTPDMPEEFMTTLHN